MKWNTIRSHYLLRLAIFWLLFFALFRVLFIIYHHAKIPDGEHSETSMAFLYGVRLDIATTCMLLVIPYVLWTFQQFYKHRFIHIVNLIYNITLIGTVSLLSIFNIKLYGEYGNLLDTEDLVYLLYPKEAITFLSLWSLFLIIAVAGCFAYYGVKAYRANITNFSIPVENKMYKFSLICIIPIILFVLMRGGLQDAPINEKNPHYSNLKINNDIATNNIWYLGHSISHRKDAIIDSLP
jgi:hypothetical protein